MTPKKTLVRVTIGGEEYVLKSERPEEYTRAVAEYVDHALAEVFSLGTIVETRKAAILAALAIADELFRERQSEREVAARIEALTKDLSRLLPPAKRKSRATR